MSGDESRAGGPQAPKAAAAPFESSKPRWWPPGGATTWAHRLAPLFADQRDLTWDQLDPGHSCFDPGLTSASPDVFVQLQ